MQYGGIDVSVYQGEVQWEQVKKAGVEFAMIRAGWSGYQGGLNLDKNFHTNVEGVQKVGMPWGVYLYAYDKTPEAAVISARRLAQELKSYRIPYPVAYDMEDPQYLHYSKGENTAIARAFLEELQGQGFYVMLYTFTNFANGYLNMEELRAYDFWVADYREQVGYKGPYGMWQYSNVGRIEGIGVSVDLNWAYKDYPGIMEAASLNGFGQPDGGEACRNQLAELQSRYDALEAEYRKTQIKIRSAIQILES